MLLIVKKKAEKEVFQWTTFIKRKQMRVFIRLAQNYGSTNEKIGFYSVEFTISLLKFLF